MLQKLLAWVKLLDNLFVRKKDSSIVASVRAVAEGRCEAVVSAGSTGAAMAASLFGLGRIHGVQRPAISVTLPTMKDPVVLIDGGANSRLYT